MISYRPSHDFAFTEEPKYISFSNQMERSQNFTDSEGVVKEGMQPDGRNSSFIVIKDSHFENLAYQ